MLDSIFSVVYKITIAILYTGLHYWQYRGIVYRYSIPPISWYCIPVYDTANMAVLKTGIQDRYYRGIEDRNTRPVDKTGLQDLYYRGLQDWSTQSKCITLNLATKLQSVI